jgi:uncharacterized protein (DUF1684 family)
MDVLQVEWISWCSKRTQRGALNDGIEALKGAKYRALEGLKLKTTQKTLYFNPGAQGHF